MGVTMTPWMEYNSVNLGEVPSGILGVFQLARGEEKVVYIGRADRCLAETLKGFEGYTHFQWVKVPWTKEGFEMQCRLYHHYGGCKVLDNKEHPSPPPGKFWNCAIHCTPVGMCPV